jgi:hypothetical protein
MTYDSIFLGVGENQLGYIFIPVIFYTVNINTHPYHQFYEKNVIGKLRA